MYIECFINKMWLERGSSAGDLELIVDDDAGRLPVLRRRRGPQLRAWWGWGAYRTRHGPRPHGLEPSHQPSKKPRDSPAIGKGSRKSPKHTAAICFLR